MLNIAFTRGASRNLTGDGRWTYSWDAENRLVQMIRDSDSPAGARQKLVFEYDHQGRRIRKQFFTYSGGWQEQTDTIFLYDGWNLVAELNANASNARVRTYVWGSDLSGSMQGAGGVGGLLKLTYYGTSTTNAFVAYEGNGNVTALIDAANGNAGARYEYGPFAEPIRSSGSLSKLNPICFSTKYTDDESGFLYYAYRYYNPSTGRWPNRDPIGEQGGVNLYGAFYNNPLSYVDRNGLDNWPNGGGQNAPPVIIYPPTPTPDRPPRTPIRPYDEDGHLLKVGATLLGSHHVGVVSRKLTIALHSISYNPQYCPHMRCKQELDRGWSVDIQLGR